MQPDFNTPTPPPQPQQPQSQPEPEPQPQPQPEPQQPQNDSPFMTAPPASPPRKSPKRMILVAAAIVVVLVVVGGVAWLMMNKDSNQGTAQNAMAPAKVTIAKDGFKPASIKVKKGQAVEWVNDDATQHTIASDPHPSHDQLAGLDSVDPLNTGESYLFTFETAGTYTYHDDLNPDAFKGTVIVE